MTTTPRTLANRANRVRPSVRVTLALPTNAAPLSANSKGSSKGVL
jgi:hypothetical protein